MTFYLTISEKLLQRVKKLLHDEHGHPTSMLENGGIFEMVMSEFHMHEEQVSHELVLWIALSHPKSLYLHIEHSKHLSFMPP